MDARAWMVAGVLVAVASAGCSEGGDDRPPTPQTPTTMVVTGAVRDDTLAPVAGAVVALEGVNNTRTTDPEGLFRFDGLPVAAYNGTVSAAGYHAATFHLMAGDERPVTVRLAFIETPVPPPETVEFNGFIECGAEYFIISGSCDHVIKEFNDGQGVFADERVFDVPARADWATIVVDIAFEPLGPGLDGLRVGAYTPTSDDQVTQYERFHQAHGDAPFTLRLEPGTDYGDNVPTPDGGTTFRFQVFPHGHGWRQGCNLYGDVGGQCFLGLGASGRIDFELLVTTFYQEPAPEGWTLLA